MPDTQTVIASVQVSIPPEKTLKAKNQIDELIVKAYNSANYNDFSQNYAQVWAWADSVLKPEEVAMIKKLDPYAQSLIQQARTSGKNADWERQRLELLELEAFLLILINKIDQDTAPATIHEVVSRYDADMAQSLVTPDQKNRLIQNLNSCYSHLNYYNQIIQKVTLLCQDSHLSEPDTQKIIQLSLQNPTVTTEELIPVLADTHISEAAGFAGKLSSELGKIAPPVSVPDLSVTPPASPLSVHQLLQQSASAALEAHGVDLPVDEIESLITRSQTYPPDQLEGVLTQFAPQLSVADRRELSQILVVDQLIAPSLHTFLSTHSVSAEDTKSLIATLSSQLAHDPHLITQPDTFSHLLAEKTHLPPAYTKELTSGLAGYLNLVSQTTVSAQLIPAGSTSEQVLTAITTQSTDPQSQNIRVGISLANSILSSLPDPESVVSQTFAVEFIRNPQATPDQITDQVMQTHSGLPRTEIKNQITKIFSQPQVNNFREVTNVTQAALTTAAGFGGLDPKLQTAVLDSVVSNNPKSLQEFISAHPDQNTDVLDRIRSALSEASPAVIQSAAATASQIATPDPQVAQLVQQFFTQNPQASASEVKD